jgi:hypothetical protein
MSKTVRVCGKEIRIAGRLLRVGRLEADGFEFLEFPEPLLRSIRKFDTRIDLFTFIPRVSVATPTHPYPFEWDNYAALPVSTFDHWWTHQIGFKARNKAKQAAKKGVIIREVPFDESLVKGIWEIYNECPIRQGRRFWHYGKDLARVYEEEATFLDRSIFIGAFLDDKLIGFVKLVFDETHSQASTMNIISMIAHRDKAPTNALIAQAVRSCAKRGFKYLVYSHFAYVGKHADGITKFKEINGFQRVDVPRYFIPLTSLGWVAFRLGLHHGLVAHLPEPVAEKLRELRASWYRRRFSTVKETA